MPLAPDKIRLNSGDIAGDDAISKGNAKAIQKAYANALVLGEEMEMYGWLLEPEALDFLKRQEALCAQYEGDYFEHHKHQQEHLKAMRGLVNDMRLYVDKMLHAQGSSKP